MHRRRESVIVSGSRVQELYKLLASEIAVGRLRIHTALSATSDHARGNRYFTCTSTCWEDVSWSGLRDRFMHSAYALAVVSPLPPAHDQRRLPSAGAPGT